MMNSKDKKNADVVSDMLNNFSFSPKGFCEQMQLEHRTIQQSFTRLCIEWLQTCADANYRYDGRNEASHKIAVELALSYGTYHLNESFEDISIPMI